MQQDAVARARQRPSWRRRRIGRLRSEDSVRVLPATYVQCMGRGERQQGEMAPTPRRSRETTSDDEHAETVSVTLWTKRSKLDPEQVEVEVSASAFGADLCNDYDIPEADGRDAGPEPFNLDLLRGLVDEELAAALADELGVPYRGRSGIANQAP